MTVRHVRVGDVLRLERTKITPDPAGTYRQIGVYSWGKGIIENEAISGAELSKVTYYQFPPNALILSNIQAWEAAIAVSTDQHADEFIASQRFLPYVPIREDEADTRYLLHFFLSDSGMALIRKASPGTVTRNRTLGIKAFESLTIPLPDLDEQISVVRRLDGLSHAERAVRDVSTGRTTFYRGLQRHILGQLGEGCEPSPLHKVLTEVRRDVPVAEEQTYPMLGVRSFGRGAFDAGLLQGSATAYSRLREVRTGDVVYPKLMAWEGAFAVVPAELEGRHVSPEFCTFEINQEHADVGYLRHLFSSSDFLKRFTSAATGTNVRRRRLQPVDFLNKTAAVPALDVQRRMVEQLDRVREVGVLAARQETLAAALPQAARNEVFARLV